MNVLWKALQCGTTRRNKFRLLLTLDFFVYLVFVQQCALKKQDKGFFSVINAPDKASQTYQTKAVNSKT